MKLTIEKKESKEIEFEAGFFKKKDYEFLNDLTFYAITETNVVVITDNTVLCYNHGIGHRHIESAITGQSITKEEFANQFEKTITIIKNSF